MLLCKTKIKTKTKTNTKIKLGYRGDPFLFSAFTPLKRQLIY